MLFTRTSVLSRKFNSKLQTMEKKIFSVELSNPSLEKREKGEFLGGLRRKLCSELQRQDISSK